MEIEVKEIEVSVNTEHGVRVSVSEWGGGSVWLNLQGRYCSMSTVLTRDETRQLFFGLGHIWAKEFRSTMEKK